MTPPDLPTLRALVRGQLDPESRRAVARWLVRYADSAIGATLDALAMEWRELQRDQHLPENARRVGEVFWQLAERGLAQLDPDPQPVLVPILRTTLPPIEHLAWRLIDAHARVVRLDAWSRATEWATLAATNDAGDVHVLYEGPHASAGLLPVAEDYACAESEGRVTFWLFPSRLERPSFEALEIALRGVREDDQAPRALRLTSDSFAGE